MTIYVLQLQYNLNIFLSLLHVTVTKKLLFQKLYVNVCFNS